MLVFTKKFISLPQKTPNMKSYNTHTLLKFLKVMEEFNLKYQNV